jgi:hypothetical protein
VLRAYQQCCAICRLRHDELLEAAHILPDGHPLGEPVIPNGLRALQAPSRRLRPLPHRRHAGPRGFDGRRLPGRALRPLPPRELSGCILAGAYPFGRVDTKIPRRVE